MTAHTSGICSGREEDNDSAQDAAPANHAAEPQGHLRIEACPSTSMEDIRDAHSALMRRVSQIENDLKSTRQELEARRASEDHRISVRDDLLLRRTLIFARRNALKAITGTNNELNKSYAILCEGKTVRQIIIKSTAMDCTLLEFRVLASAISRNANVRCKIFPSEFYAQCTDCNRALRFEILFPTYRDFCDALGIDASFRETGFYTERRTMKRELRAIQVLGIDLVKRGNESGISKQRRVLLGGSYPDEFTLGESHCLLQANASWTEGSWESGFEYRKESASVIRDCISQEEDGLNSIEPVMSDLNGSYNNRRTFSLFWERSARIGEEHMTPDSCPGTLRSTFPAVVLRGRKLTSSTQKMFSQRINGYFLKQIVVSAKSS